MVIVAVNGVEDMQDATFDTVIETIEHAGRPLTVVFGLLDEELHLAPRMGGAQDMPHSGLM